MAATFNTSQMMTLDFYQENYEEILGEKIKPGLANLIDFMTGSRGQSAKLLFRGSESHPGLFYGVTSSYTDILIIPI